MIGTMKREDSERLAILAAVTHHRPVALIQYRTTYIVTLLDSEESKQILAANPDACQVSTIYPPAAG